MKLRIRILSLLISLTLVACNSARKSDEVPTYDYQEENIEMTPELKKQVPDWVQVGSICWGLVIQLDDKKNPIAGKPVKAKVVMIGKEAVKMKALEEVNLVENDVCARYIVNRGETWDEKEGDLYLTYDEAVAALKAMNIFLEGNEISAR